MNTFFNRSAVAALFAMWAAGSIANEPLSTAAETEAHPIPAFVLQMTEIVCDVIVNPEYETAAPDLVVAKGCSNFNADPDPAD